MNRRGWPRTLRPLLLLLLGLIAACSSCGAGFLAELDRFVGDVEAQSGESEAWLEAGVGRRFQVGHALRTGPQSIANLRFTPDGRVQVAENTLIRFQDTPPDAPQRIHVDHGQIEIETVLTALEVQAGSRLARVGEGSRVRVDAADASSVTITVEVGSVEAVEEGKVYRAGEMLILQVGQVVAEIPDSVPAVEDDVAASAEEPTIADAKPAEPRARTARERDAAPLPPTDAPDFLPEGAAADAVIDHSGTTVLHDPEPPTLVRFTAPPCADGIAIEVRKGSHWLAAHRPQAVLELTPGRYRFRSRCEEHGAATFKGTVVVQEDSGTRPFPSKAPQAEVNADGMRYRVQYQNLLPIVSFRWPTPPQSEGYTLEIKREGQALLKKETDSAARITLPSGTLQDGSYRFRMHTAGGRSSLEGSLEIAFDNAARTAYLSAPDNRGFDGRSRVRVAGAVLAGATVRAGGAMLPVSGSGRFEGTTAITGDLNALTVEVTHPRGGTHHYLRHPR